MSTTISVTFRKGCATVKVEDSKKPNDFAPNGRFEKLEKGRIEDRGHLEKLWKCLKDGRPATSAVYQKGLIPLVKELGKGNLKSTKLVQGMLEETIYQGANVRLNGSHGLTPLHHAAMGRDAASSGVMIDVLHQAKAEMNAPDAKGLTPLDHAVITGVRANVSNLLRRGAKVTNEVRSYAFAHAPHLRDDLLTLLGQPL